MSKQAHVTDDIYGNYKVLHPDGGLMFRCSKQRIDWYLNRDLAYQIDSTTIQLSFIPKGYGRRGDLYYASEKFNRCVCCGTEEKLNRHHLVPRSYRKYLPKIYSSRASHDVLPLCIPCHHKYEVEALKLKRDLIIQYGLEPVTSDSNLIVARRARTAANALVKHKKYIPEERCVELLKRIEIYLEREPTDEDVQTLAEMSSYKFRKKAGLTIDHMSQGDKIVELIEDYDAFVFLWRKHFLDTMNPQFMPTGWDLYRKYND